MRKALFQLALAAAGMLALAAKPHSALAAPVSVSVVIERFVEVQNPDPQVGQGCCGDYYPRVRVDGFSPETRGAIDDEPDIKPYWTFTKTVDDAGGPVTIQIEVKDEDSGVAAPDDIMDLNPIDGVQALTILFDPRTGTWSGDVPANVGFSAGDGDHDQFGLTEGGEAGKILFGISLSGDGDTDDDGIPDDVERFGVRDGNGNLVADLATMGADPCRKSIALEVDWMGGAADGHTHRPTDAAVNDAVAAMNGAPLPAATQCPYFGFPQQPAGVNLLIDRSNQIPEQAVFPLSSLPGVRDSGNFNPDRRPYFHYVLFVHDQKKDDSSSGRCCSDNRDYIASLGSWGNQVGTFRDQSGTILHELGHSLSLGHGGSDGTNYKPNYLSVMNYSFDPTGIPDSTIPANIDTDGNGTLDQSFRLDYSRSALPGLNEASAPGCSNPDPACLRESAGIGDGTDSTFWWDPTYTKRTAVGNAAVNWNQNASSAEAGYRIDLNRDYCVDGGPDALDTTPAGDDTTGASGAWIVAGPDFTCNTTATGNDAQNTSPGTFVLSMLSGFDDWQNIKYRAAMSVNAGGAAAEHGEDMTFELAQLLRSETFALYRPDLTLTKSVNASDASPGDTLTYTLTARNVGTGSAKSVQLDDTLPSGLTSSQSLGVIAAGGSEMRTLTYTIPCTASDLARVVNTATTSGTNLLNNPEVNTQHNGASASTTVHAPVLTLAKIASSSVNSGEPILYRLTYENTGSGEAKSVAITDTLPADVYYSVALDGGAGPRPSSVTRNADGTTTLTWSVGSVAGGSGPKTVEYTARPSLLFEWTAEMLARIQATDQRFDGADGSAPDGKLSPAEAGAALSARGTPPEVLRSQLAATYFNLATRRIGPSTAITSKTDVRLGLTTVRAAALYSIATLALPVETSSARYSDAIQVLDEINQNKSEQY
ncbi:MAG: DUF11 domain-containing protein [Actinobacteria bacterium]|nr:DUF11 domain-containing protein [Actinomycetota bacterium]